MNTQEMQKLLRVYPSREIELSRPQRRVLVEGVTGTEK